MAKRKKPPPQFDLNAILHEPMTIKIGGVTKRVSPFEAQFEQCAAMALGGNIGAANTFIRWCLSEGLITKPAVYDDHQYSLIVPRDWEMDEFWEMYLKQGGPPPWPGKRDGLTDEARAERKRAMRARR